MAGKILKYSPKLKKEVCEFALKENIVYSSRYYKVNRKTVSKWVKIFLRRGTEGLAERKERNDNQPVKIGRDLIEEIIQFKNDNPNSTLQEIREKFSLKCSLVLISSKLKKYCRKKEVCSGTQDLYLTHGIIHGIPESGWPYKMYRFEIFDSSTGDTYYSLCEDKNTRNLCVFVKYVLSNLADSNRLDLNARIITNISYLMQHANSFSEYEKLIKKEFNIELLHDDSFKKIGTKISTASIKDFYSSDILSTKVHFIPLFRVDNILRDINVKNTPGCDLLEIVSNNKIANKLLQDAFNNIERMAEKAKDEFNFDKALEYYRKIYSASLYYRKTESIRIKTLYKKALILYYLESYSETKGILFEILQLQNKCNSKYNSGQVYYLLGMIYKIENNSLRSNESFEKAVNIFKTSYSVDNVFDYYKAIINKQIVMNNYQEALRAVNKYLAYSKHKNNTENICSSYDFRSVIYFQMGKYCKYAKDSERMLSLSNKAALYKYEITAISNLINLNSYYKCNKYLMLKDELLIRLNTISRITKREFYVHLCNVQLGNYYFGNGDYSSAIEYFKKEIEYLKKINYGYYYYMNLYYLALCYYYTGKHNFAMKHFYEICLNKNRDNYMLAAYSYNFIARIYDSQDDHKNSILNFKRSHVYAKKSSLYIIVADSIKSIGYVYSKINSQEKAVRYFKRALRLYRLYREYIGNQIYNENVEFISKKLAQPVK